MTVGMRKEHTAVWNKFKIKTRWVAVYLGTHCNIGSKRACWPTGQVTQLFTYLLMQHCTACYAHIGFTFVS